MNRIKAKRREFDVDAAQERPNHESHADNKKAIVYNTNTRIAITVQTISCRFEHFGGCSYGFAQESTETIIVQLIARMYCGFARMK